MSLRNAFFLALTLAAACGGSTSARDDECDNLNCAGPPPCPQGTLIPSSGGCCRTAICSCANVECPSVLCEGGQDPFVQLGDCCPSCPAPQLGCEGVECAPVAACGTGYAYGQVPGACCRGCLAQPDQLVCARTACVEPPKCQLGYVPGDLVGGCCYECSPDALFCNTAADCVIADRPRSCCGCPEAISKRSYATDPCWSGAADPRTIPPECYPQVTCDALCGACSPPGSVECQQHRCVQLPN